MLAHIAYPHGSPSSTLVLPADDLPSEETDLAAALADAVDWLHLRGQTKITKIALIKASDHPLFDLDYKFVQVLPRSPVGFDFRGSCGHSVLSSAVVASRLGWLPKLAPGHRVRVNVVNNGDHVVCEVDESVRDHTTFTVHFLRNPESPLRSLLLFDDPVTEVACDGDSVAVSGVSAGNPYVFVRAEDLGIQTASELFAAGERLFARLGTIRATAARELGFPADGAFPKIAALLPGGPGRIVARAISVPSWHPTLALTGSVCLGAATKIFGSIPHSLAGEPEDSAAPLAIETPGGTTRVRATASGCDHDDVLSWVSVPDKRVTYTGSIVVDALHPHTRRDLSCLQLT
jgi:2-methylaconitate cis-trans-isomerase PrpF